MRIRWLALMVCLLGWASSPVAALLASIHLLEHDSAAPGHSLDPRFVASHGHHHEVDVPDHSHEAIPFSKTPSSEFPDLWFGIEHGSEVVTQSASACPTPVALPPPQLHALCVMLL